MKLTLLKTALCSALIFLLLTAGCGGNGWPLSSLQKEIHRSERLTLPSKEEDEEEAALTDLYTLYYPDINNRFLVPVTRKISSTEMIARSIVENLIAAAEPDPELSRVKLYPPIPSNTIIRGLNIEDGLATLNLSASFLTYPQETERLVLGSICGSLLQFENIKRVLITVEGVKIDKFPGGTPGRDPFEEEDVMINPEISDEVEDYQSSTALTVYFAYGAPNRILYVPVIRVLSDPPAEDPAKASLEELLAGPRHRSDLFSDIPADTRLLDFEIKDGIAIVNLSAEFTGYHGGKTGEENMLNLIVLTLTAYEAVDEVKILVAGKEIILPEGADLSLPLSRPEQINYLKKQ